MTARTRAVVVAETAQPDQPATSNETLQRIGDAALQVGARVIVDEVYLDAVFADQPGTAVHLGQPCFYEQPHQGLRAVRPEVRLGAGRRAFGGAHPAAERSGTATCSRRDGLARRRRLSIGWPACISARATCSTSTVESSRRGQAARRHRVHGHGLGHHRMRPSPRESMRTPLQRASRTPRGLVVPGRSRFAGLCADLAGTESGVLREGIGEGR